MNKSLCKQVIMLIELQRYKAAEQQLRDVLSEDMDAACAHRLLSLALEHQGRYPEALQEANAAIALKPDNYAGYYFRSRALSRSGKLTQAEHAIQEALRMNPEDADCYAEADSSERSRTLTSTHSSAAIC